MAGTFCSFRGLCGYSLWSSSRSIRRTLARRIGIGFAFLAGEIMTQVLDLSMERLDRGALARQVESLLARLHPEVTLERRRDARLAVPVLFRLTPLDEIRQPIKDQSVTVVGKDISRRGVSFYHDRPLPYRRALISAEHPSLEEFTAEIDVTWCRFTKPGWYESGGRLVAAIAPEPPVHDRPAKVARRSATGPPTGREA
jgi:hypothetical protein